MSAQVVNAKGDGSTWDVAAARRRNTFILSASLSFTWSVVQLAAGFAAITMSELR